MNNDDFNNIIASFQATHRFQYNDQLFPFNMQQFNCFSDYFNNHPDEIQSGNIISLLSKDHEANIHPSNDSIEAFIKFCQFQKIQINNDNVLTINYLSKKYNVQKLIDYTTSYISLHRKELSLQFLTLYRNYHDSDQINSEEGIAQNLIELLDNDMLLQLPVPTIYRILSKYQIYKQKEYSVENDKKVLNFLFKCLEKHGRKASVLFSYIDSQPANSECINRLLSEFSDIFDFHFINPLFLTTVYEQQNVIIKNFEQIRIQNDQLISKLIDDQKSLSNEIEKIKEENKTIKNEMNSVKEENKTIKSEMNSVKEENKTIKNEMDSVKEENKTIKNEMNSVKEENKTIKNEMNSVSKKVSGQFFKYDGNQQNCFRGIIHYLTEQCGGNVNDKGIVIVTSSSEYSSSYANKNAVDLDNKNNFFASDNESNSWLKYDFKDKKVHPTHYSIRSRYGGSQNPKTWIIEGSNNNSDWKTLDTRTDETCLSGYNLQHTFNIQTKLDEFEYFRYLRIKQTGKSTIGDDLFALSALEYFGYLD